MVNVYRSDGGRTTISFGPVGERTEGQIFAAFGAWLDLFNQRPHKVLTFDSPYAAIEGMSARPVTRRRDVGPETTTKSSSVNSLPDDKAAQDDSTHNITGAIDDTNITFFMSLQISHSDQSVNVLRAAGSPIT